MSAITDRTGVQVTDVEKELRALDKLAHEEAEVFVPRNWANRVLETIVSYELDGSTYDGEDHRGDNPDCRCFYGAITGGDYGSSSSLATRVAKLTLGHYGLTMIENALHGVYPTRSAGIDPTYLKRSVVTELGPYAYVDADREILDELTALITPYLVVEEQ